MSTKLLVTCTKWKIFFKFRGEKNNFFFFFSIVQELNRFFFESLNTKSIIFSNCLDNYYYFYFRNEFHTYFMDKNNILV